MSRVNSLASELPGRTVLPRLEDLTNPVTQLVFTELANPVANLVAVRVIRNGNSVLRVSVNFSAIIREVVKF